MQLDLLDCINDNSDEFSVYSKATIDDGVIVVRPCVEADLLG